MESDYNDRERGAIGPELLPALVAPGSVYLTGEDQLRLSVMNAAAGVRVQMSGRLLNARGEIVPYTHEFAPATDRTVSTLTRAIGDGWLLEATVRATAGTPLIGQCYAILSIARGSTGNVLDLSTLAAGYVTAVQRLAWPGAGFQSSLDGAGNLRQIAGTTPGAGAEVLETVPTGARWELLALRIILTTAVTVANRQVALTFDDGNAPLFATVEQSNTNLVASTTNVVTFAPGFPTTVGNRFITVALPIGLRLAGGYRFRTVTLALQAGDQYSAVAYLVREFIEGA